MGNKPAGPAVYELWRCGKDKPEKFTTLGDAIRAGRQTGDFYICDTTVDPNGIVVYAEWPKIGDVRWV